MAGKKSKASKSKASVAGPASGQLAGEKTKASKSKASTAGLATKQLAPSENADQVVRCAENVALLAFFSRNFPISASPIPAPEAWSAESQRQLSYEQEDRLVKELAFLSGISDNPNHIMAVCVQELPRQGGCEITLAVNRTSHNKAQNVLEKAQRGFQLVFGRLRGISPSELRSLQCTVTPKELGNRSEAGIHVLGLSDGTFACVLTRVTSLTYTLASSDDVKRAVREAVFNDIIAVSRERILSRMRSSKYKASFNKRQQYFVGFLLRNAFKSPWRQKAREQNPHMTERDLEIYDRRIQSLLEAMEAYEASDPTHQEHHENLARLVRKIAHFKQSTPLRDLLATLTDAEMHEPSRERLLTCIDEIARYREIAKFLCREAQGVPMLRDATVSSLKLPVEAFARSTTSTVYNGTVASVLDKLSVSKYNLPACVQKRLEVTPKGAFASEVNQTLRESKIHAEIQILAYYEAAAPAVMRPRVIASSKDACYLCHAFISLHGQYSVPKTHGWLYTGWRLPATRALQPLQQRLNEFLEQQVRRMLERLHELGGFPSTRHTNESTLFPLTVSASLLSSMRNLSIVSNHSRLDLTAAALAADRPSQVSFRALGTSVSGVPLLPAKSADVGDDPKHSITDQRSQGDMDGQRSRSVASDSARKDGSADIINGAPGLVEPATESFVYASASDASLKPDNRNPSDAGEISATTASSCPQAEHRGDTILSEPATAANDWFRYKNIDFFVEESSAKFSHKRLSLSVAVEMLRNSEDLLFDVCSLDVGSEVRLPKGVDGKAYFACGDEAIMVDTGLI